LALVREGGIASDNKATGNPRQIGGQILGDPVRKVLLLSVVAEVRERQHDYRQAWRNSGL